MKVKHVHCKIRKLDKKEKGSIKRTLTFWYIAFLAFPWVHIVKEVLPHIILFY